MYFALKRLSNCHFILRRVWGEGTDLSFSDEILQSDQQKSVRADNSEA